MAITVNICTLCEKEFENQIGQQLKTAYKTLKGKIDFSHGFCPRHAYENYTKIQDFGNGVKAPLMSPEKAKEVIQKYIKTAPPDLKEHPELVKLYSKGIFTPDDLNQNKPNPQPVKEDIEKPVIRICANCQQEFNFREQVKNAAKEQGLMFTHGVCHRHFIKALIEDAGMSKEESEKMASSIPSFAPDLKEHPELVKSYLQGVFTLSDKDQPLQSIKEFFQKRAGIIHS